MGDEEPLAEAGIEGATPDAAPSSEETADEQVETSVTE
jgi:hypothetical protein